MSVDYLDRYTRASSGPRLFNPYLEQGELKCRLVQEREFHSDDGANDSLGLIIGHPGQGRPVGKVEAFAGGPLTPEA